MLNNNSIIKKIKNKTISILGKYISTDYPIIFIYNNKYNDINYSIELVVQLQMFRYLRLSPIVQYISSIENFNINHFTKLVSKKSTIVFGGYNICLEQFHLKLMEKFPNNFYIQLPQINQINFTDQVTNIVSKVDKFVIFVLV